MSAEFAGTVLCAVEAVGSEKMTLHRAAEKEKGDDHAVENRKHDEKPAPGGDHLEGDDDQKDLRQEDQSPGPEASPQDCARGSCQPCPVPDVQERHDEYGPEGHGVLFDDCSHRLEEAGGHQAQAFQPDEAGQQPDGPTRPLSVGLFDGGPGRM